MEAHVDETTKLNKFSGNNKIYFGRRHELALLSCLGLMVAFTMRVNMSVAVVSMATPMKSTMRGTSECGGITKTHNTTFLLENVATYDWDNDTQGWLLAAFFYGFIITPIPTGMLAQRIGGKKLFAAGILCSAIFNMIIPLAAKLGTLAVFVARFVTGLGEGSLMPALHCLLGKWIPLSEMSHLSSFAYAGVLLGTIASLAISGQICGSQLVGGWPTTFYIFGSVGCMFVVVWTLLIYDTPSEHPRISPQEREYIETSLPARKMGKTPWRSICTSRPMYAISAAHFGCLWGAYTMITGLPLYMNEILGFEIEENGLLSCLPFVAAWIVSAVAGPAADYLRQGCLSTTGVRKLFQTLAFLPAATLLLLVQFAGCNTTASVAILVLAFSFDGFTFSAYTINHLDLSPEFAGTLMGISSTFGTLAGMTAPVVMGYITAIERSQAQWQIVFYITAGVYVVTAVIYLVLGSGENQDWDTDSSQYTTLDADSSQYTTLEADSSQYTTLDADSSQYTTLDADSSQYTTLDADSSQYATLDADSSQYTTLDADSS